MKRLLLSCALALLLLGGCGTLRKGAAPVQETDVLSLADTVWAYSLAHPDGFTLHLKTMTQPSEGIAVSYAATQHTHAREGLRAVLDHALAHEGYVGGWLNAADSLYYFDSVRLFPEDSLSAALRFGRANAQHSVFILSTATEVPLH